MRGKSTGRDRPQTCSRGARERVYTRARPRLPGNHHPSVVRSCAFTLVELLVVISIIALLMALLFPVLQRVRKQAKSIVYQAKERQAGLLFSTWAAENRGNLMQTGTSREAWARGMAIIVGPSRQRKDLLLCPVASRPGPQSDSIITGGTLFAWSRFRMDATETTYLGPRKLLGSYAPNRHLFYRFTGPGWLDDRPNNDGFRTPVNVPVWLDCVLYHITPFEQDANSPPPPYEEGIFSAAGLSVLSWSCINRHEGGVNCLFLDWSVRKVGLKELWTLKWNPKFNTVGPWTKAGGVRPEDWPAWMRKFKDY